MLRKSTTAVKSKVKPEFTTTTPEHSEIILDYSRFGNIGYSQVYETIDIFNLSEKELRKRIPALFHFIRNTSVIKDIDTHRTATLLIDCTPILSITQKAGNYDEKVFTLAKYKSDGSRQSTRKYAYNDTKNMILNAFGFDIKVDEDEDLESESVEDENIAYGTGTLLPDTGNFDYDTDNGFDME